MAQPQSQAIAGLLGMNQRQAMDDIPDNYSPFLLNISNDRPGTWGKRKGSDLLGSALSSSDGTMPIKAILNYAKNDGTNVLRTIRDADLYTYDSVLDTNTNLIDNIATDDEEISAVNYKNRAYYVGPTTPLRYETGSASYTTANSGNEIYAQGLVVSQQTLFVAGITKLISTAQDYQDRVYYSRFNLPNAASEPNQSTHEFWELQEVTSSGNVAGTITNSSRWFSLGSPFMSCIDFLNKPIFWTKKKGFSFDLSKASNALGRKEEFSIGICGLKARTICNDWLLWMDAKGHIQMWGGNGKPAPISWELEDDEYAESIINKIDKAWLPYVSAGAIGNKFYFSIGDITYMGTTYQNCLLKGLLNPDGSLIIWGVDSLPFRVTHFERTEINGEEVLVMGASDNNTYRYGVGSNDNGVAINAVARTKFYSYRLQNITKNPEKLLVKYRPQPNINTYLSVRYALDGKFSYTDLSTPDAVAPVTNFGVIDMSQRYNSLKLDDIDYIYTPVETKNRSISYEFSNNQLDEDFEISLFEPIFTTEELNRRSNG